jgi:hypothetical protein
MSFYNKKLLPQSLRDYNVKHDITAFIHNNIHKTNRLKSVAYVLDTTFDLLTELCQCYTGIL